MPESRHIDANLLAFGQAVRRLRERRGMSIDEFAAATAMPRKRIDGLEIGQRNPPYDQVIALADALRVEPSAIQLLAERLKQPRSP